MIMGDELYPWSYILKECIKAYGTASVAIYGTSTDSFCSGSVWYMFLILLAGPSLSRRTENRL